MSYQVFLKFREQSSEMLLVTALRPNALALRPTDKATLTGLTDDAVEASRIKDTAAFRTLDKTHTSPRRLGPQVVDLGSPCVVAEGHSGSYPLL